MPVIKNDSLIAAYNVKTLWDKKRSIVDKGY
jgi:hypothetical protein